MKDGVNEMKAYKLHDINVFKMEDVERPVPKEKEVLVKVHAAGICGSDIPRIYRTGTYNYPLIPGHEFSGEVVELGEGTDSHWDKKRVGIFPLIPCRTCKPCLEKKYELCRHYSYLGSRRDGGFAEYVTVPEWNLIELPDNVEYEAAAMFEPMAVAVHAMRAYEIKKNDTVVVYGLGTIGMLLLMFLCEKGIDNIYVVGNKQFQKDKVIELGISPDNYCDSKKTNALEWLMNKTDNCGAEVVFECVGNNSTITDVIDMAAPSGKVMLVGNPASDMTFSQKNYWKILRNQLTVKGSWNSSYTHEKCDDWNYVLDRLREGSVNPKQFITHKYDFDKLITGLEIMRDKSEEYLKIMITN